MAPLASTCTPAVSNQVTHPSTRRCAKSELKSRSACITDSRSSAVVIVSAYGVPPEEEAEQAVRITRQVSRRMDAPAQVPAERGAARSEDQAQGFRSFRSPSPVLTALPQRHSGHRERRTAG